MPNEIIRTTLEEERKTDDERLLEALAMLGGTRVSDEDLVFDGDTLVIPANWTARDARSYLNDYIKRQDEETEYERIFRYRPHDGAAALQSTLRRIFGSAGVARGIETFFGRIPPTLISVPTGVDTSVQVPWGLLQVPLLGGTMHTEIEQDPEYGPLFKLTVYSKRKYKGQVEGLFIAIAAELRVNSIYKGQAINGATNPEFIDLRGVSSEQVVYSAEVQTQLRANVWSLIDHTEQMRERGLPLKRAVMFIGDYGTGKSLGGLLTAQRAVRNGWTFIFCRPGRDDLEQVMTTARLYMPAVVFFEDLDKIADGGDHIQRLLDTFDGITAKGTELMCVMTTNHPERIVKGMLRPGRVSAIIEFGGLDVPGVEALAHARLKGEDIADDVDWGEVAEAMGVGTDKPFAPAFIVEALEATARYSMARNSGYVTTLTTADFVHAARGLETQLDLMLDADEGKVPDSLGEAYKRAVRESVDGVGIKRPADESTWAKLESNHQD